MLLQSVLASRFPGVLVADGGSPGDGLPGHGVAGTRILGTEREQLIGSSRFGLGGDRSGRDVGSLLLLAPGGGWLRPRIATRPSVGTKREVFGANAQPGLEAQRRKWRRVLAAAGRPDPVVMRGIGVLPSVTGHLDAGGADLAGTIRAGQQASSNEDGAADLALTAAKAVATRAGAGAGRPSFGFAGEAPPADDLDGDWPCERISPRPVGLAPPLADSCPLHNSNAASRLQPLSASSTVTVVTAVSQHSVGASLEAIIGLSVAAQRLADWRMQRSEATVQALRQLKVAEEEELSASGEQHSESKQELDAAPASQALAIAAAKRVERQRRRLARFGRKLRKQVGKLQAQDDAIRKQAAKERRRKASQLERERRRLARKGIVDPESKLDEQLEQLQDEEDLPFEDKVRVEVLAGEEDEGGGTSLGALLGIEEG